MANFTKPQIIAFLDNKIADAWRGATTPGQSSTRFLFLRLCKILIEKDIITADDVNTAFTEWI